MGGIGRHIFLVQECLTKSSSSFILLLFQSNRAIFITYSNVQGPRWLNESSGRWLLSLGGLVINPYIWEFGPKLRRSWASYRVHKRLALSQCMRVASEVELSRIGAHTHFSVSSVGRGPYTEGYSGYSQADLDGVHIYPCDGSWFRGSEVVTVESESIVSREHPMKAHLLGHIS